MPDVPSITAPRDYSPVEAKNWETKRVCAALPLAGAAVPWGHDVPSGARPAALVILGLLGALLAALCYGVATVCQSVAATRTTAATGLDPRLLGRLLRQTPYLAGLILDVVGFAASALALRTLPLFLVQSAVAASVGVTALVAVRVLGVRLGRPERWALAGVGLGLGLLAVSAQAEAATATSSVVGRLLLAGVAVVLAAGLWLSRLAGTRAATGVAACAGLAFGGAGIAARVIVVPEPWWRLALEPTAWALVGYGLLGVLLFVTALQRGSAISTAAVTFAVETVVPAAIGLAVLGDQARPGFGGIAAAGFLATVIGAMFLARYAEPVGGQAVSPVSPEPVAP